jgi:hypothetical protein
VKLCLAKGLKFGPRFEYSNVTNVSPHKAVSVKQFVAQKSITEVKHPPSSPDLASNDSSLLPKIVSLKRQRFQDAENIQKDVTTTLKTKCVAACSRGSFLSKLCVLYSYVCNKAIPGTS